MSNLAEDRVPDLRDVRGYTAQQAKPAVRILTLTSNAFVTPVQSGKSNLRQGTPSMYFCQNGKAT